MKTAWYYKLELKLYIENRQLLFSHGLIEIYIESEHSLQK